MARSRLRYLEHEKSMRKVELGREGNNVRISCKGSQGSKTAEPRLSKPTHLALIYLNYIML
jgi:hypothetical protein